MNRLRQLFYGRNGFDALNMIIIVIGAVFLFLSAVLDTAPLAFVFLVCLLVCLYRALSTDLKTRRWENNLVMGLGGRIEGFFKLRVRMIKERKTHKYLKCPGCKARLRVPRGRGKINIRCVKCGVEFIRTV
ncbi:MAG: hypothetical protein LBV27_05130 [Oscillospiraceae bacterium]|jgi:uncharacterized paraquat-inducible protein A|nr:hypothetical protein [Oscillospiraceae bacterium]